MILFVEGTQEDIKALLEERAEQTPDPPPLPQLEPEEVPGPPISRKARLLNAAMASLAAQTPEVLCRKAARVMGCIGCPAHEKCPTTLSDEPCADELLRWLEKEDKTQ